MLLAASLAASSGSAKRITVIFRLDDVSASTTSFDGRFVKLLREHDVAATLGVIPFVTAGDVHEAGTQPLLPFVPDGLEAADLIDRGQIEIAMHGFSHQAQAPAGNRTCGEFGGLAVAEQESRIAAGKRHLEQAAGVNVSTFIPPWNGYDSDTLKTLSQNGFRTLCARIHLPGTVGDVPTGVLDGPRGLKAIAATSSLPRLRRAVDFARRCPDSEPIILVLIHAYDFREVSPERGRLTLDDLDALFAWLSTQTDLVTKTVGQTVAEHEHLAMSDFLEYTRLRSIGWWVLLPEWLRCDPNFGPVYPSRDLLRKAAVRDRWALILRSLMWFGGLLTAAILCAMAFKWALIRNRVRWNRLAFTFVLGLLVVCTVYAFRDQALHYRGAMVLTALLGLLIGLSLGQRRDPHQPSIVGPVELCQ